MDIDINLTSGERYYWSMGWLRKDVTTRHEFGPLPLMVHLHAPDNPDKTTTALMRPRDLYIIGVRNKLANNFYDIYFNDYTGAKFVGIKNSNLPFSGHYKDLGPYSSLSISRGAIERAISAIAGWKNGDDIKSKKDDKQSAEAKHLLMLVLIISEAARYWQIEVAIGEALDGKAISFNNDAVQDMANDWSGRSKRGGAGSPMIRTR